MLEDIAVIIGPEACIEHPPIQNFETIVQAVKRHCDASRVLSGIIEKQRRMLEPSPCGVSGHRMCDWEGARPYSPVNGINLKTGEAESFGYCLRCAEVQAVRADALEQAAQVVGDMLNARYAVVGDQVSGPVALRPYQHPVDAIRALIPQPGAGGGNK